MKQLDVKHFLVKKYCVKTKEFVKNILLHQYLLQYLSKVIYKTIENFTYTANNFYRNNVNY